MPSCRLPSTGTPMALPRPAEDSVLVAQPAQAGRGRRQLAAGFLLKPLFSRRVFMLLQCSLLKTGGFCGRHGLLKKEFMLHSR